MDEGNVLEVVKALYGLPTSGNMRHAHLSHTLREISFKPAHFDTDVWIRGRRGGYYYIGMNSNDVLVVDVNPTSIFNNLKETYKVKTFGPPKTHLGCDYSQVKKGATTQWVIGYTTYNTEALRKVYALLNVVTLRKEKLSSSPGEYTELYSNPPTRRGTTPYLSSACWHGRMDVPNRKV